jgi:hypothetical protein
VSERPTTHQKAFQINLDPAQHGTFAEIGAGQEVARWFFHVGGAASTVAKTISAYDMAISDALYGPTDRYVSRQRLAAMLDHEYALLLERLGPKRGRTTRFFVFADTVAARSYTRHEAGHGWLGVRFQHQPLAEPSEIITHVRLLDTENAREQEALGILGVNLVYGAFHYHAAPHTLIASLMDGLTHERIEVDMIKFGGPCFAGVDNRLMSLQLVEQGFTDAAMFTVEGEVVHPADALHKRPVLILRGNFRPVTNLVIDMLERAKVQFETELQESREQPVVVMEMSLQDLRRGQRIDHADFLARADILGALGQMVMISSFAYYYRVTTFLRRYTSRPIAFAMGVPALTELFDEKYYADLSAGILEAMAGLFKRDVLVFVYPSLDPATGQLITAETFMVGQHLRHLHAYLLENHFLQSIRAMNKNYLHISPRDVIAKIQSGDPTWETMVPTLVAERIKQYQLFGIMTSNT